MVRWSVTESRYLHRDDWATLRVVLPLAMSSAREQLGSQTLGMMMVLFGLFDFVLCTLAGMVGFYWSTLFSRTSADPCGVASHGARGSA